MRRPDFLVVGAARSGTTALHYSLRSHPGLFLPNQKEPCFFCFDEKSINYKNGNFSFAVKNPEEYFALFKSTGNEKVAGEISTPYLYLYQQTIDSILRHYKGHSLPKIVIVLRNPVERAWSQYLWKVRDGREELSFSDAITREEERIKINYSIDYHYTKRSFYADAVNAYLSAFPFVKIILYDDFKNSFERVMKELVKFLGADKNHVFEKSTWVNSSAPPRFPKLGRIITAESKIKYSLLSFLPDQLRSSLRERFIRLNTSRNQSPAISEKDAQYLKSMYRDDLLKLQKLTGLDLYNWLDR